MVMTVGDRIKKLREKRGINQIDFATKIDVSKQTLYKYENNIITNIPSNKIESAAKILNCSPSYLMGWENTKIDNISQNIDTEMSKYINKLKKLNSENKNTIYNIIDFLFEKQKYTNHDFKNDELTATLSYKEYFTKEDINEAKDYISKKNIAAFDFELNDETILEIANILYTNKY